MLPAIQLRSQASLGMAFNITLPYQGNGQDVGRRERRGEGVRAVGGEKDAST